jgi:protein-tyrosine phosphatase
MQTETLVRHLPLAGPGNFRDLGGYRTYDGRRTRWRRLFRSDSLHHLTSGDIEGLAREGIGIKLGLDLRTERELKASGHGEIFERDTRHLHVPFVEEVSRIDPETGIQDMLGVYLDILERGQRCVSGVFDALSAAENYPAVFYCSAGKDRTGILTALILLALGVSEEDVITDYSMTDEHMHQVLSSRIERARAAREAAEREAAERQAAEGEAPHEQRPPMPALAPEMLRARPETMRAFLATLDGRYGSALGYLHDCGVGAAALSALRGNVLD